ncbi:MAG: polyphosphate kinase 2 family protein [Bacillota bacterium]
MGMIDSPYLVEPGARFRIDRIKADDTGPFRDKPQAKRAMARNAEKMAGLQQRLYAQAQYALLVVLQGMDTSGKDGTIKRVFNGINPQGCSVVSFKVPSREELAHDYLWRIHMHTPPRGMIDIFNRSHYESVLVERVHELVPEKIWRHRYDQINAFERLLAEEGTTILKLFLHISKDEQKKRLEARLRDPQRNWKFDPNDLKERALWNEYQAAYEDALRKCSTEYAPWYIIPADHKWFRNWLVSDLIVRTLESLKLRYPPPVAQLDRIHVEP